MAATVKVYRYTGAGPTGTDITSINTRVDSQDGHSTASTTSPVLVPVAGTNYSYWCSTRLNVTVAPSTMINNVKWYTDGSNSLGTGVGCNVGQATSYVQATGTSGTTGDQLTTTAYSSLTASPSDAFAYTSGSPLGVTGTTTTTGTFGNFVVYQFTVGTTAAAGATGSETITWRYDET